MGLARFIFLARLGGLVVILDPVLVLSKICQRPLRYFEMKKRENLIERHCIFLERKCKAGKESQRMANISY